MALLSFEHEGGWARAEIGPNQLARIGSRDLPKRIEFHFDGADGQPSLSMRFEIVEDVPQCREVRFTSTADGREVRQVDLGAVKVATFVEDVFALFAMDVVDETEDFVALVPTRSEDLAEVFQEIQAARKGKGARTLTRAFLQQVADVYVANVEGSPTKAIAQRWNVAHGTAAQWVWKARNEYHFLGTTESGKKGV